jgi:flagellar hook-length control protein FliK
LAAQQLAAATPADADSKLQPAAEIAPAESAPAQSHAAVAKQQPRAKGAKQAAQQPASAAKSEHPSLPAEATPADAESNADQAKADAKASAAKPQDLALRSATHAAQESTPDKSVEPKDNVKASQAEPARDHGPQPEVAASKPAAKSAAAQAVGAAQISEPSRASKKPAVESSRDDVPKKGDKRSAARTFAVSGEAASSAAERPANAARTADTPPMPTVATGAPQQLPVAEVTVASSANANTSSKDSAAAKQGLLSPFARLERGVHGTRGGQRSASGEPARHVDPARFVSRVARAIHTAQERGGPLQLRLSPPELGAMRLELAVNQGALTATIETDNSTTRQLLLDHLPALRERLAEQNVKIERFDVDVRRDPGGGQQNTAPQDRGNQHHQRTSTPQAASRRDAAPPVTDPSQPIRRSITNTSINVVA